MSARDNQVRLHARRPILGAPVDAADVPRWQADAEADECPRGPQPMPLREKLAVLLVLAICAAMVAWSVETMVR